MCHDSQRRQIDSALPAPEMEGTIMDIKQGDGHTHEETTLLPMLICGLALIVVGAIGVMMFV